MVCESAPDGTEVFQTDKQFGAVVLFPNSAAVRYHHPRIAQYQPSQGDYVILGPTYKNIDSILMPEKGLKSHAGILSPFTTEKNPTVRSGSIYVNNGTQSAHFFTNEQTMEVLEYDFQDGEFCVGTNWHMSSATQAVEADKSNAFFRVPFNGVGRFIYSNKPPRYAAFIGTDFSVSVFRKLLGQKERDDHDFMTIAEVAALMNVAAVKSGASEWEMCGLEYMTGGAFPYRDLYTEEQKSLLNRDLFIVTV